MSQLLYKVTNPAGIKEWRKNWPVVVAAIFGYGFASVHTYSLGIMIAPLEEELQWSRAEITSGLLVVSLVVFPLSPVMGLAIDRFGPRRIALFGMSFYFIALAMLSQAGAGLWTWWLLWFLLALAALFIKPTVWVASITSLFNSSRGLALAVTLSATGFVSFGAPLITYYLVESYGWRMAYVFLGGGAALITLPMLYFFFSSAMDRQRSTVKNASIADPPKLTGLTLREGFKSPAFYKLAAAAFIMTAANVGLIVNIVPILTLSGITRGSAAAIAGILGLAQIFGRISGGFLLDRFDARIVAGVTTLLPIGTCFLLLAFDGSLAIGAIAVLILGLCAGAETDVVAYLAGRLFGMRNFGAIFGTIIGLLTLGVGMGPMMANVVYDLTKSYDPVLWLAMPAALLTSLLLFKIGPYPVFEDK